MFYVAISDQKIDNENIHQVRYYDKYLTVYVDNKIHFFEENDSFCEIKETDIIGKSFKFSSVKINMKDEIHVYKSTSTGSPIYYSVNKQDLFISSSIKELKKLGVSLEVNNQVLGEYFVYRYVTPPVTMYKNIFQIHVGSEKKYTGFGENSFESKIEDVYLFSNQSFTNKFSEKESVKHIDSSLSNLLSSFKNYSDSVSVPLSGGLDSSILFKKCHNELGVNQSCSAYYPFESKNSREVKYALSASKEFNSKHKLLETTSRNYINGLIDSIYLAEEPVHHLQSVLLYLLFRDQSKKGYKYVISGEGAGVFGTGLHKQILNIEENWYLSIGKNKYINNVYRFLAKILGKNLNTVEFIRSLTFDDYSNPSHVLYKFEQYGDIEWVKKHFNISENEIVNSKYRVLEKYEEFDLFDKIVIVNILMGSSKTKSIWSKLAESQGMFIYYPLNDLEILQISQKTSWETKLKDHKFLLKEVAKLNGISEYIINRPKSSFGLQPNLWAVEGSVFEVFKPLLLEEFTRQEVEMMQSTDMNRAMTFWNMINYSIWKRLMIFDQTPQELKNKIKY